MKPRTPAKVGLWLVAVAVLTVVFSAYLSPHVVVDLANRVWACF
jgi:hypothetical protein